MCGEHLYTLLILNTQRREKMYSIPTLVFVWASGCDLCTLLGKYGGEVWKAVSWKCLLARDGEGYKNIPAWQMVGIVEWKRQDILVFHQVEAFLLQWIFSTGEQDDKQQYHKTLQWKQVLWCPLFTWNSPTRDIYMWQNDCTFIYLFLKWSAYLTKVACYNDVDFSSLERQELGRNNCIYTRNM